MKRFSTALGLALLIGALGLALWALLHTPDPPPPVTVAPAAEPEPEPDPEPELPPLDEVEWPADAPRTLYGTVTDPEGNPIIGARIRVQFHARRPDRKATTDTSGSFELERVQPDVATFEISARGYEPDIAEDPHLPAAPRVRWDAVLEPADGLFGVVLTGSRPAPGAWVALRPTDSRRWLASTHADSAGRFALDWPEDVDDPLTVWAFHGQHGTTEQAVAGPGEVTLTLPGGGYIEGHVVDTDGRPVPQFSITATPLIRPAGGPPAQSFNSDVGHFVLGPLAAGRTRVWAAAEGYQPGEISGVEVEAGQTVRGLRIELGRSPILTGRVTDAGTGQPIEGAMIVPAEWRSGALAETVGAYTDEEGRYRLQALPGVRTSIQVTADGYRSVLVGGVEGAPGQEIVRDFSMSSAQRDATPASELTGIGAVLAPDRRGIRIRSIVDGGPASTALEAGDVVVMVDGVEARGAGLAKVAQAIRGEVGTEVELWVRKRGRGEPQRVMLTRDRVVMPERRRNPHQPVR